MLKRLKEVNENLKKFTSVNRKALDQYVSFNEQRANLVGRKEELSRDTSARPVLHPILLCQNPRHKSEQQQCQVVC